MEAVPLLLMVYLWLAVWASKHKRWVWVCGRWFVGVRVGMGAGVGVGVVCKCGCGRGCGILGGDRRGLGAKVEVELRLGVFVCSCAALCSWLCCSWLC